MRCSAFSASYHFNTQVGAIWFKFNDNSIIAHVVGYRKRDDSVNRFLNNPNSFHKEVLLFVKTPQTHD